MDSYYFACGLDMSGVRFARRLPNATWLGRAEVSGFRLAFAGPTTQSRGGTAVLERADGSSVSGVLWALPRGARERLDAETKGFSFTPETVTVTAPRVVEALAYVRKPGTAGTAPSAGHIARILSALDESGIDSSALDEAVARFRAGGPADGLRRLFVYGTLRLGEANARFLQNASFLGTARTNAAFQLADLGAYPALVQGGRSAITGEIYDVDAGTLARLDRLEGHPDFYRRIPLLVDGAVAAEAYVLPASVCVGAPRLLSGDWKNRRAL